MLMVDVRPLVMPLNGAIPTPVHAALDRLTVISIRVQHVRRTIRNRPAIDSKEADRILGPVEADLRELTAILVELRDRLSPD